jgi:glycerophosphoryl diester phosphodiesterase
MSVLLYLIEKIVDCFFAAIPRPKPPSHVAEKGLLIAHRGAHDNQHGIFENTFKAFQRAKDLGCWGIECDVHCTADGFFVVHHDPNLRRLWQHDAEIADLSFSELRTLAPEIPSLEEVINEYSHSMHLFIELKIPLRKQHDLLKVLQPCVPIIDYHLLTLNPDFYTHLEQLPKAALLLVAVQNNVTQLCDLSIKKPYGGVLGNYLLLSNKQLRRLEQAQQIFGVGFVNSKNSLYRELNRGISWLFTNEAQRVIDDLHNLT